MTDLRSEAEAICARLRANSMGPDDLFSLSADVINKLLFAWGAAVSSGSLAAGGMIEQTRIIDNLRAERDALAAKLKVAEEALTALSIDRGVVWGQSTEAEILGWRNHTNALIEYARAALSRLTAEPASKGDEG